MSRAAGFPLVAPLPSIESLGVTRRFPDFFGNTGASDFSEIRIRGVRRLPSRGCLSLRRGISEISRFPCKERLQACRSLRPRGDGDRRAHSGGSLHLAFRKEESVGSPIW